MASSSQAKRNRKRRAEILAQKRVLNKRRIVPSKANKRKLLKEKKMAEKDARKKSLELKKKNERMLKKLAAEEKKAARKIARKKQIELEKARRKKSNEMKKKALKSARARSIQLKKDNRKKSAERKKNFKIAQKKIEKFLIKKKNQLDKEFAKKEIARLRKEDRSKKRRQKLERMESRKNKPQKSEFDCSKEAAEKLQMRLSSLVPTTNQIENMTHRRYTNLRRDMSKSLVAVNQFSSKCNKSYGKEKASLKRKTRSPSRQLPMFKNRPVYLPRGYENVQDTAVTEADFARAQARIIVVPEPALPVKRQKKRVKPILIG